jgi:hypothetical protein
MKGSPDRRGGSLGRNAGALHRTLRRISAISHRCARAAAAVIGFVFSAVALPSLASGTAPAQVAVAVFASDPAWARYERTVQTRLEELLRDNGLAPLDEKRAEELRRNWIDLADPGRLITAEEVVQKSRQYQFDVVYRVSFTAGTSRPLDLYHSATASVQLRLIDRNARVEATASRPMGVRGFASSDAFTEEAALVNALQRAVDALAEARGLKVLAPASARAVPVVLRPLEGAAPDAVPVSEAAVPPTSGWSRAAVLAQGATRRDEPSCEAVSPDGSVGLVGTHAWAIDRLARARTYGGYLHVVDVANRQEATKLTVHELGNRGRGEDGTSAVLACGFMGSWRHAFAASGNRVVCFDLERGRETCSHVWPGGPKTITVQWLRAGARRLIRLDSDQGTRLFEVVAERP